MPTPWDTEGTWLRCQLHAHTTNSDGEPTPEGLVEHYARAGYDVTTAFTYSEAAFTLPDGTQELYAGYVLTDPAGDGSAFTYTFY